MKTLLLFISFSASVLFSSAQINSTTPWTWMKGDNTIDQLGVYGTQGIAATSNKPGARNFSTTWRDVLGNLWLFGGSGYAASGVGHLNDLWKYNTSTNLWTWVKGDNTTGQHSVYGTKGTANISNKPGGTFSSVSWTDATGTLWLFGGYGYTDNAFGFLNTLWKYNSSTNEWTWVNGDNTIDQPGVYGVKGVASNTNKPGARYGSETWVDISGNLWLFGGYGYDNSAVGNLNDIWKYNPATNQWVWIKGDNISDQPGIYGAKGVANSANKPGARYLSTSWVDASNNLWMFGGYGFDESDAGSLNDLWKYNSSTNEWTWINGDKAIDQTGKYGTLGVAKSTNKPGARYVSSAWKDVSGDLWLFGGYGFDASTSGYLNDLWKYNPATNKWTWMKGDNMIDQAGIYGTQGIASPSNKSGARTGSVSWNDGTDNLWLFGGYGYDGNTSGVLNDLWKISSLQAVLPLHLLEFNGVLNNETVKLQWTTEQETDFSHFNIQRSFDGIEFRSISMIAGAGNTNKNDYNYFDNDLKNRQVQKVFYRLQSMDKDGSFIYSKILLFNFRQSTIIKTFPNPAIQSLNISFDQYKEGKVIISITDMSGVVLKKQTQNISSGRASINTDISILASGTYLVSITNNNGIISRQKFIKQ